MTTMTNRTEPRVELIMKKGPYLQEDEEFSIQSVELEKTTLLKDVRIPAIKALLSNLYKQSARKQYLAALLNAIITEKKFTFVLSPKLLDYITLQDLNIPHLPRMERQEFLLLVKHLHKANIIAWPKIISKQEMILVGTLTHPALLNFFSELLGPEVLVQQKLYVLQAATAIYQFEIPTQAPTQRQTPTPTPTQTLTQPAREEPKARTAQDSLVEGARKKAQDMGLLSRESKEDRPMADPADLVELKKRCLEWEVRLTQEQRKLQVFMEQARQEEDLRLASEDDLHLVQNAVMAGIRAGQQRRLVESVELEYLKLRERYEKLRARRDRTPVATHSPSADLTL